MSGADSTEPSGSVDAGSAGSGAETSDVVDGIVEAFGRRDLDAFAAGYAADAVIEDALGGVLVRGLHELRARYGAMFERSPELRCEVLTRIAVGDYVVDEERITGRVAGAERLVVVYHLRDGVVDHERIFR